MTSNACPHCQSDRGTYDGPNGTPRCLHCFADQPGAAKATTAAPKGQPKTELAHNKAEAPPQPIGSRGRPTSTRGK
jgi:hypothetical protein